MKIRQLVSAILGTLNSCMEMNNWKHVATTCAIAVILALVAFSFIVPSKAEIAAYRDASKSKAIEYFYQMFEEGTLEGEPVVALPERILVLTPAQVDLVGRTEEGELVSLFLICEEHKPCIARTNRNGSTGIILLPTVVAR